MPLAPIAKLVVCVVGSTLAPKNGVEYEPFRGSPVLTGAQEVPPFVDLKMPAMSVDAYRIAGVLWSMVNEVTEPVMPVFAGAQLDPPFVLLYSVPPDAMYSVVGVLVWMVTASAAIVLPSVPFRNDQLDPPLVESMSPPCDVAA